jgi:DnaJ family protein C protein 27
VGNAAVGKSCLIKRYCEGRFVQKYITTIGIDYGVKPCKALGHDLKVNFFDTSGGEEFKEIRIDFYDNVTAVLLVYDVTNRRSFTDLESWLEEAQRYKCPISKMHATSTVPLVVLCANKVDLPRREVQRVEGVQFADAHGMQYFETSACTGDSVMEAMNALFERVVGQILEARKRLGAG